MAVVVVVVSAVVVCVVCGGEGAGTVPHVRISGTRGDPRDCTESFA
eukprot:SAG11_NODE_2519_length_3263_cov_5.689001_5_plen_46_part_00